MTTGTTPGTGAASLVGPGTVARLGGPDGVLDDEQVREFVVDGLAALDVDGRSVCVLVPDATRECPLPLLVEAVHTALHGRAGRITVLVALGTHPPMSPDALARHLGHPPGGAGAAYPGMEVLNHEWWRPETFVDLGTIPAARLSELSGGRLEVDVPVQVNRHVVDHDLVLVVGPVLPHEVVGMSGGNKYLFPGAAGQRIIDVSHWLGALITSAEIIGTTGQTPVRSLIDEAAALVPSELLALSVVTSADPARPGLHSVSFGSTLASWADAAEVSAATHVRRLEHPVRRVISLVPQMYDELWTGAKGFYKVEPVVADGGEVVLFAPHITELGASHPEIDEVGYHCRDYFVQQWDRFRDVPWGVLAHSTHLRGAGTYDATTGEERLRVRVTLASGISEERCRAVGLGYLDPATLDLDAARADPDTLVVDRAGEVLHRLA